MTTPTSPSLIAVNRHGGSAMADPFFEDLPKKKPQTHEIGQDLSAISVDELGERIALLKREIERIEAERAKKDKAKSIAADLFKTKT